ncbi:MAG: NAD(+) diphosphatase [Marinilabiliaceae bacterium]|nr:NAD(+) diphosphatase [Marinilabiliaceae bacterium]
MIQDIYPHQFNNQYISNPDIKECDLIFSFNGNKLLLKRNGKNYEIPQRKELKSICTNEVFLFTLNNTNCFLAQLHLHPDSNQFIYHEIKSSLTIEQKDIDWTSQLALQLKNWYENSRFCGKCGKPTIHKKDERAVICPFCKITSYPKISPAIIVAIFSNDKILLANGSNFSKGFYSLVAGYIDIGESIEDTVIREVKEEIGIDIKNIRYYKSQPWPWSGSMMIGFTAEADDNQLIKIDKKEIAHAAWFTRENLPNHPTTRSIAGELIEKFFNKEF